MQLSELRKIAKEKGLKNITKLKKQELIELLKAQEEDKPTQEEVVIKEEKDEEEKEEFVSRKWCI